MSFTLSFFFIYFILFYFLDMHMSQFFFIGFFFLWFIYIRLFIFCTTLTQLEIKNIYIDRTCGAKLDNNYNLTSNLIRFSLNFTY